MIDPQTSNFSSKSSDFRSICGELYSICCSRALRRETSIFPLSSASRALAIEICSLSSMFNSHTYARWWKLVLSRNSWVCGSLHCLSMSKLVKTRSRKMPWSVAMWLRWQKPFSISSRRQVRHCWLVQWVKGYRNHHLQCIPKWSMIGSGHLLQWLHLLHLLHQT